VDIFDIFFEKNGFSPRLSRSYWKIPAQIEALTPIDAPEKIQVNRL